MIAVLVVGWRVVVGTCWLVCEAVCARRGVSVECEAGCGCSVVGVRECGRGLVGRGDGLL